MKPRAVIAGGLLVVGGTLVCASAVAQRVQFPSPDNTAPPAAAAVAPAPAAPAPAPIVTPPPEAGYAQPALPPATVVSPSTTPYGALPAPTATAPPPPGLLPAPGAPVATPFGPAPVATLNGTIQPPPAAWDPYAPPSAAPAGVLGQDPYLTGQGPFTMPPMIAQAHRFLRDVTVDYEWFAGHGSNSSQLGINNFNVEANFAIPVLGVGAQEPIIVTPGFAFHFWDGPASVGPDPADLPPETYDAYIDAKWNPRFTPEFGADLEVKTGVFSDFKRVELQSIRVSGMGEAVVTLSPCYQLKAGVWYVDRVHVKLLPAGGIVWTPNPDVKFEALFPNPKLSQRFATTAGCTEWWWYFRGEYGGGTWTVKRAEGPDAGNLDTVSYDDIRIALGVEFKRNTGIAGHIELGYSFSRQLVYRSEEPYSFNPTNTMFVGAGIDF